MKKAYLLLPLLLTLLPSCGSPSSPYQSKDRWVERQNEDQERVDTFLLAPTPASGDGNMEFSDEKTMNKFAGTIKMQQGIYDGPTRIFAPYYHAALLNVYSLSEKEREPYLEKAYADVKEAFSIYLKTWNKGNKIILAGFSQGADMALRLLKDFSNDETFYSNYLATYAIGWALQEDMVTSRIVSAKGEVDQKVVVSFDCETPEANSTIVLKEGEKMLSINPLSWTTSTEVADASLNKGAVFLDRYGAFQEEIPHFCSCYVDPTRGTLKVTGVDQEKYAPSPNRYGEGSYHPYDFQFFYRNLEENVKARIG